MADLVRLEKKGAVAIVTIDRPDALNAINVAVVDGFNLAIDEIEADAGIRAVVVTGAGRAFVAGADISEMKGMTPLEAEAFSAKAHRIFGRLEELPIVTIAAVNGFALGGGASSPFAAIGSTPPRKPRSVNPRRSWDSFLASEERVVWFAA